MGEPALQRAVPQIQREPLNELRAAYVQDLLHRHWEEISHYPDILLDVDWHAYEAAEANGKFRLFTVRVEGAIVGYASYFVNHNPHYKASYQAVQDVLFLAPEHRNASIGRHLIAFADTALKAEGVQVTYQHSKIAKPIDAVLRREGYECIERIWAKRHDRERKR